MKTDRPGYMLICTDTERLKDGVVYTERLSAEAACKVENAFLGWDGCRVEEMRIRSGTETHAMDKARLDWLDADDNRLLDVHGHVGNNACTVREAIDTLAKLQGTESTPSTGDLQPKAALLRQRLRFLAQISDLLGDYNYCLSGDPAAISKFAGFYSRALDLLRDQPPQTETPTKTPTSSTDAATQPSCDHGVTFDEQAAARGFLDAFVVRKRWPRLHGTCPKGCGFNGIAYASKAHYVYGDW